MQTAPPPSPGAGVTNFGGDSDNGTATSSTRAGSAAAHRPPEDEATEHWTYELFGCLSDWRICCATFLCPCYTLGRNAAYFGDDGALAGLLYCFGLVGVCNSQFCLLKGQCYLH